MGYQSLLCNKMTSSSVFIIRNQRLVSDTSLEKAVFEAAQQGDNHSFGKLYDSHFDAIFRFIYYRTNHQETAEDLTEEVFLKAFRSLSSLKGGSEKLRGWLYSIARNTVIDHYRKTKETINLESLEQLPNYEDSVVERLEASSDTAALLETLKQLPPDQQTILKLRFFEDLSIAEISTLLNKSEGNIRVIQYRGLQQLKKYLTGTAHS